MFFFFYFPLLVLKGKDFTTGIISHFFPGSLSKKQMEEPRPRPRLGPRPGRSAQAPRSLLPRLPRLPRLPLVALEMVLDAQLQQASLLKKVAESMKDLCKDLSHFCLLWFSG